MNCIKNRDAYRVVMILLGHNQGAMLHETQHGQNESGSGTQESGGVHFLDDGGYVALSKAIQVLSGMKRIENVRHPRCLTDIYGFFCSEDIPNFGSRHNASDLPWTFHSRRSSCPRGYPSEEHLEQ